jgi:hypothetical protein
MKTIVIRPEIIGFDNTGVREPKKPLSRTMLVCLTLIPAVAIGGWAAGRFTGPTGAAKVSVAETTPSEQAAQPLAALDEKPALQPTARTISDGAIELQAALENGLIAAETVGNGRDHLEITLSNKQPTPLAVKVSFGQMFESGRNLVVVARSAEVHVPAGQCAALDLQTVATRSTNVVGAGSYRLSPKTTPKLDMLLSYAQDHPEITSGALQTAVLALTDNLPLSALCKFTSAAGDLPSRFDTSAFRVDTGDLVSALATLREIGVSDRELALTVDPQLKLEAMIEPQVRSKAMSYYGIPADKEWDFWKSELLAGENGTRHYALFGIARFYPQVALEMLPKWAREKRTNVSFRLAAVQALADTRRAEALPILQELVKELGRNTELGRAAVDAAQYLDGELMKAASVANPVAVHGVVATADL